jgi:hypothetical protein
MSHTRGRLWTGRGLSALAMFVMIGSALAKLARAPEMVAGFTRAGLPEASILPIAILELLCAVLYLLPRTSVLGTLLVTGYLGGAIVVQITSHQSIAIPLTVGIVAVAGACLRNIELQNLLVPGTGREARQ